VTSGAAALPQVSLAPDYQIPRLIKGGWQLANGHSATGADAVAAIADMMAFAEAGITAFDCADIYTGVEELIGQFLIAWRAKHGPNAAPVRIHTKCVPDLGALPTLSRRDIERTIDRSLTRLGVERLDLVQFHWWDYAIPGVVDAALHLRDLQREGKIHHLGATNFDTAHLTAMLDAGVNIVAHQVQVSLLDGRALREMSTLCNQRGVGLLAYGALAGGFLHERWLGTPEPLDSLENRSLVKYKLIIDDFGGWAVYQSLLQTLANIARAQKTTLGAIALRYVLDQPAIAAAIVGARNTAHLQSTIASTAMTLTHAQADTLRALAAAAAGPIGDVYTLERDKAGRHASIMRYNLNRDAVPNVT
jgi:aryl-alcohol dehydrogenase-like predicted oxidoreductase